MRDNEQKAGSVADQKNKIRERYKGVSIDELDVIPALPQEDIFAVENEQRVAVYARVSTDDPRQTSSYELQKNHYHDVMPLPSGSLQLSGQMPPSSHTRNNP